MGTRRPKGVQKPPKKVVGPRPFHEVAQELERVRPSSLRDISVSSSAQSS